MRTAEGRGRSVEEAVEAACRQLSVPRERVEIEVLEEPSRGLFGIIGQREARVRVVYRPAKEDFAVEFIQSVARHFGLQIRVRVERREDAIGIEVEGDDVGALIGRRGATLNGLQYLMNVAASRACRERTPLVLDVAGYRKRRRAALEGLARRMADRAARSGRKVMLEPMTPEERRFVHLALQGDERVRTESRGEEPNRRVVIRPVE